MNINRRGDAYIASSLFCAGAGLRAVGVGVPMVEAGINGWTSWHHAKNGLAKYESIFYN